MPCLSGGIIGAPGAAIGRIFFSTERLLEEFKTAQQKGRDTKLILCLPASFAEDVKAIEVATGVLSTEGGYSAHASVVARQYGKVSLVKPDMKIKGNKAVIGDRTIKEGDYVTLNVPFYGTPSLYLGKAQLIEPDPEESGMLDFLKIVDGFVEHFHVRDERGHARATRPSRAASAPRGIGLVRTEHMFFAESRINVFREMVISGIGRGAPAQPQRACCPCRRRTSTSSSRSWRAIPVIIRLLDAPLHEFLPHNDQEMERFLRHLNAGQEGREAPLGQARWRPAARPCTSSTRCSATAAAASPCPTPRSTRCRSGRSSRPSTSCARKG